MTNLALPYIAHDLDISAESSIWIVNASQIALMVTLLPIAALADIIGYRHVYRAGLALFCLASLGCALAPSLVLADRRPHRPGAGRRRRMMSVQPALVRAIYPRNMLGRGLGFNTTVVATSLAAGPSIGAACSRSGPGRSCSRVYIPLGIIAFVLGERYLPHTTHVHRPFDFLSAVMSGITFGLLIFGIDGIAHGHSAAGDPGRARRRGAARRAVRLAPDAARRSDDAGRHLQAADLRPVDLDRRPAPSPRRASPSSACPSSSTPCWARAPPTPASC